MCVVLFQLVSYIKLSNLFFIIQNQFVQKKTCGHVGKIMLDEQQNQPQNSRIHLVFFLKMLKVKVWYRIASIADINDYSTINTYQ